MFGKYLLMFRSYILPLSSGYFDVTSFLESLLSSLSTKLHGATSHNFLRQKPHCHKWNAIQHDCYSSV